MQLRELGENGFIRRIRERFRDTSARLGIGDDAAIVDPPAGMSVVYCSDLLAENVHFIRDLHPPDSLGYKCVAVNVSDVGAMGGIPRFFTLSVALPGELDTSWIDGFINGIARACSDFQAQLIGGDSSSAESIFVDVSMVGWVETGGEVRRSGAQAGDGIYVTGVLGASALGLANLRAGKLTHASVTKHLYPVPRHLVGRAVRSEAHAMIDVSDGLSTDLQHILDESGMSARIDERLIPTTDGATRDEVLHGGEEYELLIIGSGFPSEIDGVRLTRIGEIVEGGGREIFLANDGGETLLKPSGYEHFRPAVSPES